MSDENKNMSEKTTDKSIVLSKGTDIPRFGKVPSIREFMAAKAGIALPEKTPLAAMRALCVKAGHQTDVVKAWSKELDANRKTHCAASRIYAAALAADPRVRVALRESVNKRGERIGYAASFRQARAESVATVKSNRIAELEALVAKLTAAAQIVAVA